MSQQSSTSRGYAAIGLHSPKNSLNVGSALRAAGCYGAAMAKQIERKRVAA